jgi:hypothetical protein
MTTIGAENKSTVYIMARGGCWSHSCKVGKKRKVAVKRRSVTVVEEMDKITGLR